MIPRVKLTSSTVTPYLGAMGNQRLETLEATGSGPGLLDSFRFRLEPPHRDRIVYVFPYADGPSCRRIQQVFDFERNAWCAFWRWAANHPAADATVIHVTRLLTPPTEAVKTFEVVHGDAALPALLRPMVAWPPREHTPRGEEARKIIEGDTHWDGLQTLAEVVWAGAGEPSSTLDVGHIRSLNPWHLLSDGVRTIPTQWRFLHKNHRDLAPW